MALTRVFKSGNSQAVRIPAEMAFADLGIELHIARVGDVITIFPARQNLKEAVEALRAMPKPPTVEVREAPDVPDRE
ncbi:MAG: AbrB/MazE/SpoVT family DNA-binding domain-containing protein [Azospirillaceae bacterium]|nr:AbrB/MazE/SpoVT family DNA-binding domain-containing protein [Azospirillaceae bacterium]